MKKTIALTIAGLLVVIGIIAGVKVLQIKTLIAAGENSGPPPIAIASFDVQTDEWQSKLSAIGSLEAAKGLVITADLSGRITAINFDAGNKVVAGDLLVQQDVSVEQAQLRSAQASAALAKSNLTRIGELYQKKVASKSELDSAQSNYRSAIADVDNIRATIEKKSIRAPFDGSLGIRLVNLGQTINAGAPVVSLQATNQMFVNFFLPQQQLSKINPGLKVKVTSDAVPGEVFEGLINAIDPEINAATRSVKVQAILANPDGKLLTGMFASIDVILPNKKSVLLVPITAIQYATYGDSVFVIEEKDKSELQTEKPVLIARQQFVKLGERRGDFVSVEKGLSAGQVVASAGGFKLRTGANVVINNSVAPNYSLDPEVENK